MLAAEIAADVLQTDSIEVVPIVRSGSVNHVFRVNGPTDQVVVRLNAEPHRAHELDKEHRVMLLAREQGVATPEVRALGRRGDVSFQVQDFVDGEHPAADDSSSWSRIGQTLRRVHRVRVRGWGDERIQGTPSFCESWEDHVQYNLDQLGPADPLRTHGLLDPARIRALATAWRSLPTPSFGLCHGDVSVRNVLVRPTGELVLLDWGCARADVIPFADVATVVAENDPSTPAMAAFFEGYGTSWEELRTPLAPIALLSAIDLCRWAIDRRPAELPRCLGQARHALDLHWNTG